MILLLYAVPAVAADNNFQGKKDATPQAQAPDRAERLVKEDEKAMLYGDGGALYMRALAAKPNKNDFWLLLLSKIEPSKETSNEHKKLGRKKITPEENKALLDGLFGDNSSLYRKEKTIPSTIPTSATSYQADSEAAAEKANLRFIENLIGED